MSCNCQDIINKLSATTNCVCDNPGYCARHKCNKTGHWHFLCRTRPDYFALWENGRGPCLREKPMRYGLGNIVELLVRICTFRKVQMCNSCHSRKAKLNRLLSWRIK